MCGRYVSATPTDDIAAYFDVDQVEERLAEPVYNVAPTTSVPIVRAAREKPTARTIDLYRWGLIPFWAKEAKVGNRMINARAETVATNNAFKRSFVGRRCIIPADGFYEWVTRPAESAATKTGLKKKTIKQPYYITQADGSPLAFAGIYASWRGPERDDDPLYSCSIITTTANATMEPVHDRMPVLLPSTDWDRWLDPDNDDVDGLTSLLAPAPESVLTMHPVSTDVNNSRSTGAQLIEPIELDVTPSAAGQGTLL